MQVSGLPSRMAQLSVVKLATSDWVCFNQAGKPRMERSEFGQAFRMLCRAVLATYGEKEPRLKCLLGDFNRIHTTFALIGLVYTASASDI